MKNPWDIFYNAGVPAGEEQLHRPQDVRPVGPGVSLALPGVGRVSLLLLVPHRLQPQAHVLLPFQKVRTNKSNPTGLVRYF